ncbi:MAG: hypothetical protein JWN36_1380 [Microbacteriaceae bacterium]|nr:hypothetical protein [Microbacteriaceae bacterium]
MRLARTISLSTAASVDRRMSVPFSSRSMTSLPYRATVSAMSMLTLCGMSNLEYSSSVASMFSDVWPAARAFHRPSRVMR